MNFYSLTPDSTTSNTHKWLLLLLMLSTLLLSQQVFAASIGQLKAQKIAGEQSNGYVGLIKQDASADVKKLIASVNEQRKKIYRDLAKKQNIPLSEVEQVAGARNIDKTPAGQLIKNKAGAWVSK